MKVKSGLVFSKSSGELIGFSNLSRVNQDIEDLLSANQTKPPHRPSLAKKMLVFMLRPVFKPSLSFPVAAYPTTDLTGSQLFPVTWEVIEALELDGFPVIAITADGASPNRQFFRICCGNKQGCVPHKTRNPYTDRDLYFFCDPPHLIKTARNCFSNSHAHKHSRELQVHICTIILCVYCHSIPCTKTTHT